MSLHGGLHEINHNQLLYDFYSVSFSTFIKLIESGFYKVDRILVYPQDNYCLFIN